MANEFPASRSDTPLQQVPAAPYPCGPVAWVSLDARGRASSARTREGVQPVHASGEVRISTSTEPLSWRRSTAILAKPTDHGSQTAKFGLGQYQYVAAERTAEQRSSLGAGQRRAGQVSHGLPRGDMHRPWRESHETWSGQVPYRSASTHGSLFSFCAPSLFFFVTSRPPLPLPPRYAPQNGPPRQISAIWS